MLGGPARGVSVDLACEARRELAAVRAQARDPRELPGARVRRPRRGDLGGAAGARLRLVHRPRLPDEERPTVHEYQRGGPGPPAPDARRIAAERAQEILHRGEAPLRVLRASAVYDLRQPARR